METIPLSEFCRRHAGGQDAQDMPDGVAVVDAIRSREQKLSHLLPGWAVRRLDAGMARSSTVHPDTGRALYTICRALRASTVFETGTYWGYSTAYLAAALPDDNTGRVWTFDIYAKAGRHVPRSLRPRIEFLRGRPSAESLPDALNRATPQLFFQDSRHDYEGVAEELRLVAPRLQPGAVVLLHDFVEPQVRRAAQDVLRDYALYALDGQDPQQLGMAVKLA